MKGNNEKAVNWPAVFREPGALLYAGNCQDLMKASLVFDPMV